MPCWRLWLYPALLFAVVSVGLHPAVYWPVYGQWYREAFYHSMPTSFWDREVQSYSRLRCVEPSLHDMPTRQSRHFGAGWSCIKSDWCRVILAHLPPCGTPLKPGATVTTVVYDPPLTDGDPDAIPVLLELLRSRNSHVQLVAIEELGELGPTAEVAVPALRKIRLCGDEPELRGSAHSALQLIDPNGTYRTPSGSDLRLD